MSTVNGRRVGFGLLLISALLVLVSCYWFAANVKARIAETTCWFANGYLYATGLPTTYPFAVTLEPYPVGTTQWSVDGTYAGPVSFTTAYFWVRGHGPSLIKAGAQLSDYHVICIAEAA